MIKLTVKKFVAPFFFALGVFLLVLLIRKFGLANLLKVYENLGFNLIYILAVPFFGFVLHTLGWYWAIEETGSHVSFWRLLKIKLGGESVNTLTPVSFMGGDPVRILLLTRTMPGPLSTASVVLDRTMHSLAIVVLLLCGLTTAWIDLELPQTWKVLFPAITFSLIFLLWFLIHRQQKGIFESLVNLFHRLGFKSERVSRLKGHVEVVDHRIAGFYRHNRRRFLAVLICHVGGRFVGVGEIYLIAWFLKIPVGFEGALYLASLTVLINIVFVFIPGSMGVLEGAFGALCHLLNLNPLSGVAIQLVRRCRALFWVFVGLILMATLKRRASEPSGLTRGERGVWGHVRPEINRRE